QCPRDKLGQETAIRSVLRVAVFRWRWRAVAARRLVGPIGLVNARRLLRVLDDQPLATHRILEQPSLSRADSTSAQALSQDETLCHNQLFFIHRHDERAVLLLRL